MFQIDYLTYSMLEMSSWIQSSFSFHCTLPQCHENTFCWHPMSIKSYSLLITKQKICNLIFLIKKVLSQQLPLSTLFFLLVRLRHVSTVNLNHHHWRMIVILYGWVDVLNRSTGRKNSFLSIINVCTHTYYIHTDLKCTCIHTHMHAHLSRWREREVEAETCLGFH